MEAVVEYEYKAEQEDELNLKVGDVITGVQTAEGGWWEGELNGKKGMFPENFVKLVKKRELAGKKEEKREATQRKSVRVLAEKFKDGIPMIGSAPVKKKEKKKMCKVLFDYKKENDDELDLNVGEMVEFHKQVEEGWWEGTYNGKHGVFPSNFVEMVEDTGGSADESAPTTPAPQVVEDKTETNKTNAEFQAIKGKKVVGVGLGNIFGGGPIKLRPTGDKGSKKEEPASKATKPEPESAPEVTKREKQNTLERAVVRFSYTAEQPDELTLVEGDIVRIIERQLEDDGWWKGEVHGKTGVFPDNFVELLAPEEPSKPKKPPPPSQASKQNLHTKQSSDVIDDKHKSDMSTPVIGKKPQPPPPIGKKPGNAKPEPQLPIRPPSIAKSTTKENNTDDKSNSEDLSQFDSLEAAGQKLTHLTANRAKGPKKRPPSTVLTLNDGDKDGESIEDLKPKVNSHISDRHEKPVNSHISDRYEKPHLPVKENKHPSEPEPPSLSQTATSHSMHTSSGSHREGHHHSASSAPSRPPEPASAAGGHAPDTKTVKILEQLQREIADLRANTVSRAVYNELKADHDKLKADFESLRTSHSKKFRELMDEVDEEKKLRLTTQVEIERVKKFMAETNV